MDKQKPLLAPKEIDYKHFLASKTAVFMEQGCPKPPLPLNPHLFDFQQLIVAWALRKGRAALFEDCGMGKTLQQLEWARQVAHKTASPVLIFAPLAVAEQSKQEGHKFGIATRVCASGDEIQEGPGVWITNYEKLHRFSPKGLGGLVLDESSILKGFDGKTRKSLTDFAADIPFRLACSATPAPNDYMELGTHAEFLGVMKRSEMLATFFVHDGGETQKWRLKGHAQQEFAKWLCSWAVALRSPADIHCDAKNFTLLPLRMHEEKVKAKAPAKGRLFAVAVTSLEERLQARKDTVQERAARCAEIVKTDPGPWLIWCHLNTEADALKKLLPNAIEVRGSDDPDSKKQNLLKFASGKIPILISKPTVAGFGMNFQVCSKVVFVGLSDSYEQFYQAIRRTWRFGQKKPVDCYVVSTELEGAIVTNIQWKEKQAEQLMEGMVNAMRTEMNRTIRRETDGPIVLHRKEEHESGWQAILGDAVEECGKLKADSIGYCIFSPPFASLYTYSHSKRDMGNCRNHAEFFEHFRFLVKELYRTLMPGRLLSFHCMNLPTSKERDGVIGITDFRGDLIRQFSEAGFIYHSEVTIWKDPVIAMQRTKALGLLYKQLRKDSCMSRQGIPDYLVTMRKPGDNPKRVTKTHEGFPVNLWQQYASPVWMDINPSKTLQKISARDEKDERHIAPLQLQVIERAIDLWTNPNDLVLSPFAGIGSEGYVALQRGRRFIGIELKESYWRQCVANLRAVPKRLIERKVSGK